MWQLLFNTCGLGCLQAKAFSYISKPLTEGEQKISSPFKWSVQTLFSLQAKHFRQNWKVGKKVAKSQKFSKLLTKNNLGITVWKIYIFFFRSLFSHSSCKIPDILTPLESTTNFHPYCFLQFKNCDACKLFRITLKVSTLVVWAKTKITHFQIIQMPHQQILW